MTEEHTFANGAYGSQHEAAERHGFFPPATTQEVRAAASNLEQYARTFVREQPVVAICTAAGIGYLIARIFARGMR
ncbi:MAG: hypothetical protein ABR587_12705 [Candidatus Binatia bacterium]